MEILHNHVGQGVARVGGNDIVHVAQSRDLVVDRSPHGHAANVSGASPEGYGVPHKLRCPPRKRKKKIDQAEELRIDTHESPKCTNNRGGRSSTHVARQKNTRGWGGRVGTAYILGIDGIRRPISLG